MNILLPREPEADIASLRSMSQGKGLVAVLDEIRRHHNGQLQ